ncbi:UrcA family protein [Sphingomonas kaistensis]|uniref:UrcA family protein n=1 Tax=Sphingomonas kaistensis TaxID=298708 RepID=A0A7X5Y592_9SPHN|nr:UrcA family protein [Sphingomonas kaistensis]NJC05444.1 UrcA family protein [Sphingomonas kaistensis]
MTSRLKSSGIAALSFTLSAGILALALTPAMAQASGTEAEPIDLTATADRDREVRTRIVDASDVDFTSAADLKRLNSRINGAVNDVCRDQGDGRATIGSGRCYVEARLSANRQVAALRNSATLLAAAGSVKGARLVTIVASR